VKAAFVKRRCKVQIRDIPVPEPRDQEVLVRIDACGVCGSDFIEARLWAHEWKRFGHEIVATVAKTGPNVSEFRPGDQVVIALSVPCGTCPPCIAGAPRKCIQMITAEQGGFAEFLLIKDARLLRAVRPKLPIGLASFAEPLTVILDAFELAGLSESQWLLVVGGGFLGTLGLLAAKSLAVNNVGILTRTASPLILKCLGETGGQHFSWRTLAGLTLGVPHDLGQVLSAVPGRVVVLHTAPPKYIRHYLDALPFDSSIVNIGLSENHRKNILVTNGARLIFKRTQLLSAFPVPCLHLGRAIELLRRHERAFSYLSPELKTLEALPDIISNKRRRSRKILIVPSIGNEAHPL
jgi:D-arabinose 1-dehydrogenase-like Zn-dependent alcohol dehydrogenase